ncbi:MAG: hypothetical protein NDF56_02505 [archaeon GB-1845-036]|nr:hypothetical protein [Candidatus Culexmicrobium thermophilum]
MQHKDCINFKQGICTLYNIRVNPNDPACPNFIPRNPPLNREELPQNFGTHFQFRWRGPAKYCICPNCGYRTIHQRGMPCIQQTCPNCGSRMIRG